MVKRDYTTTKGYLMTISTEEKPVDSFPDVAKTYQKRAATEFMPPVEDTQTKEITFHCCLCNKVKTVPEDSKPTFYLKETLIGATGSCSGPICKECDNTRI